jgi:hypothetical protein
MLFCLGDENDTQSGTGYQQNYMVFNTKVDIDEWDKIKNGLPTIKLPLETWIDKKEMTKEEKDEVSGWSEMGGYLKHMDWDEAWSKWWSDAKESDKQSILNCKYFSADIFMKITGIKDFATKSLSGKKVSVELDGVKYSATID